MPEWSLLLPLQHRSASQKDLPHHHSRWEALLSQDPYRNWHLTRGGETAPVTIRPQRRCCSMGIARPSNPRQRPVTLALDSSGKAVIQLHRIDSTVRTSLLDERPLPHPPAAHPSSACSARRVSRIAICSRASRSKNTILHQFR